VRCDALPGLALGGFLNFQIEQWRVQAYTANVYMLSQQKASRLGPLVRSETFKGKSEYFDRMGLATAQKKVARNSPTPNLDIALSRRMVTTSIYEWGTIVDRKDKLQNIHDPENQFSMAASAALGRSMDDVLIQSALGPAVAGEGGTTTVSLGNAQKLAAVSQGAISGLNMNALLGVKQLFDQAEVGEGQRYIVHNGAQLRSLLGQTQVTSSDYNTVKALVRGELDTFLGFKFIRIERLLASSLYSSGTTFDVNTGLYNSSGAVSLAGTEVSAFAFVGDGLILGQNEGAVGRIDERKDLSYNIQVYNSMDFGGVRMEEPKVVEIICQS
jgi:Phage capsid protein